MATTTPRIRNTALQEARRDRNLSQEEVVALLRSNGVPGATTRQYQRFEAGTVEWPQPAYRRALSAVFRRPITELGFMDPEDPMHRRNLIMGAASVAAAALVGEPFARLEYALSKQRPGAITAADAEALLRASTELYEREAVETAATLMPDLARHLDYLAALLAVGTLPDSVRRTLTLAAGTTAVLGGWVSHDQGRIDHAVGYWTSAVKAAEATGDGPLLGCVLTYESYIIGAGGDHAGAVLKLRQASGYVRGRADAQARAWVSARMAEEAAAVGDHATALTSLAEAMTAHDYADPDGGRPWAKFFDASRLASMGVAVYGAMDHPQLLPAADSVMASLPEDRRKTKAVILGDVSLARVRGGDLDAGCALAHQALTETVAGEAMLGYQRLRTLRPMLEAHTDAAPVRALLPELDAAGITVQAA
jgi:transcriptional regulator with XRE-family HTH domain